jgi:hypothetical protein
MRTYIKREESRVRSERVFLPSPRKEYQQVKGINIDGGMVNIREEGWKEKSGSHLGCGTAFGARSDHSGGGA